VDHYTVEAWTHLAARGVRFAALQPVYDAVIDRFGSLEADGTWDLAPARLGTPVPLRALHRLDPLARPQRLPGFIGEPETNGCAERFIRTLKEQCPPLWPRPYATIDDLRQAVATFTHLYNTEWLIERHGHRTPREARADALTSSQAA
jgi:putative transposase